jgi:hypothetical protein
MTNQCPIAWARPLCSKVSAKLEAIASIAIGEPWLEQSISGSLDSPTQAKLPTTALHMGFAAGFLLFKMTRVPELACPTPNGMNKLCSIIFIARGAYTQGYTHYSIQQFQTSNLTVSIDEMLAY